MQSYLTFALAALTANAIQLMEEPTSDGPLSTGTTTDAEAFIKCNIGNGNSTPFAFGGRVFPKTINNGFNMQLDNTLAS